MYIYMYIYIYSGSPDVLYICHIYAESPIAYTPVGSYSLSVLMGSKNHSSHFPLLDVTCKR